jgi:hypothetical protein
MEGTDEENLHDGNANSTASNSSIVSSGHRMLELFDDNALDEMEELLVVDIVLANKHKVTVARRFKIHLERVNWDAHVNYLVHACKFAKTYRMPLCAFNHLVDLLWIWLLLTSKNRGNQPVRRVSPSFLNWLWQSGFRLWQVWTMQHSKTGVASVLDPTNGVWICFYKQFKAATARCWPLHGRPLNHSSGGCGCFSTTCHRTCGFQASHRCDCQNASTDDPTIACPQSAILCLGSLQVLWFKSPGGV